MIKPLKQDDQHPRVYIGCSSCRRVALTTKSEIQLGYLLNLVKTIWLHNESMSLQVGQSQPIYFQMNRLWLYYT